jgi:glycylpeptide N-tetradecanoyltransferase
MSPGWRKEWHVGVRVKKEQKDDSSSKPGLLVAFISAVPLKIRVREQDVQTGEVNFLCVHKKLRNKRLAPSLIKEITRRINREGIWQGLYTGGTLLPTPITTTRYFHRPINWQRLYQLGFSSLPPGTTPAAQGIRFHIAASTSLAGFRDMRPDDAPRVRDLLDRYLARYDMVPRWDEAEFDHWVVDRTKDPKKRVVFAYVVETPDGKITDFISFYRLESTVIAKKDNLHAGYLYYYATEAGIGENVDVPKLRTRLAALTNDMLVRAKQQSFDVMNALSLMDNALFLEKTKFKAGDGSLHYYLFNYRVRPISGGLDGVMRLDADNVSKMGLIML